MSGPNSLIPVDSSTGALRRLLFRDTLGYETPSEVIEWWELRRIPYNLAVGATGLVTLSVMGVLGSIGPHTGRMPLPPLIAIAVYAGMANVMFTGGWISELVLRPFFGTRTGVVGATVFRYGLVFSMGLTAMPIGLAVVNFGWRMARWMFGS